MITQCAHVERNKTFIWVNKNNNLKSHFRNFWKCNLNREAEMFTPRGPVAGSFQHTLWPRERALEVATLVSRAFAFVFSRYKVIIALSLYFSSWALQHTVHISIIAAKIVSLEFFFELQYFGPDLRLARTKTAIPIRSVQNADCRLQTGYKMQTADWVQNVDWEFILFFRLIRDNMSSYNLPSVTQSLFHDHLSRLFALLWNISCPFLDHSRS